MEYIFREIRRDDLPEVNRIYNDAIKLGYATAHTSPLSLSYHEDWLLLHQREQNPIFVISTEDKVIGWNSLSSYRSGRKALSGVKEMSYYVEKAHWGKGIASILIEKTIERAAALNIHTLVTFIMGVNEISIHLMAKFGFELWGKIPAVIEMPEGIHDHLIFGKKI